jgi:hypothetical protein
MSALLGAANDASWSAGEASCRGFQFVTFLSAEGVPVSGITVSVGSATAEVYYLNDSGLGDSPTDSSGTVILLGELSEDDDNGICDDGETGVVIGAFVGSEDGARTWAGTIGFAPGAVLVSYATPDAEE